MADDLTKALSSFGKGKIEFQPRLSEAVQAILNAQIRNELISSQIYKGMACCLDDRGWVNAAQVFFKYGQEELTHMDKIYKYMFDRNCKPSVPDCPVQKNTYSDIKEILNTSLSHEIGVTSNWETIASLALSQKDNTTYEFSQWFLKEQVEEEDKFRDLIYKVDLGMPDWELENIFKEILG